MTDSSKKTTSAEKGEESSVDNSSDDRSKSDLEALQITQKMGRSVIDHQIENLNGLNDKAAYTIRLNVLILGILLTTLSLLFKTAGNIDQIYSVVNGAVIAGVFLSGISILAALWAYTSSRKEVGPTGSSMEQIINHENGYSQRQWLRAIIRGQSNWIAENERVNRRDAFALFVSHLYLFVSIGLYSFGVVWGLELSVNYSDAYYWCSIFVLSITLPSLVILPGQIPKGKIPNSIQEFLDNAISELMRDK